MTRRFLDLMQRYAFLRRKIDAEKQSRAPNLVRLARLRTLQLRAQQMLEDFVTQRAIRYASRPRLAYARIR